MHDFDPYAPPFEPMCLAYLVLFDHLIVVNASDGVCSAQT